MARLADYFVLVAFGPHPRGECRRAAAGRGPGAGKGRRGGPGPAGRSLRRAGHPGSGVTGAGLPDVGRAA